MPPRVDHALTALGTSLAKTLVPLCTWGSENMAEVAPLCRAGAPGGPA